MSNEQRPKGDNVALSAGLDAPRWVIGDRHPDYGTVQMMGVTGGEAYRWLVNDDGCVSMIPLFMLQASNTELTRGEAVALNAGLEPNTTKVTK